MVPISVFNSFTILSLNLFRFSRGSISKEFSIFSFLSISKMREDKFYGDSHSAVSLEVSDDFVISMNDFSCSDECALFPFARFLKKVNMTFKLEFFLPLANHKHHHFTKKQIQSYLAISSSISISSLAMFQIVFPSTIINISISINKHPIAMTLSFNKISFVF